MKRFILEDLIKWKNSKYRKPLILKGARQIGKTYILNQFGKEYYEDIAYFNFDHDEDLYNLFDNTKSPQRILENLTFIHKKAILPEKTLIIFDEIQECPNALNSLKYFQEEANEYHIVCAGSFRRRTGKAEADHADSEERPSDWLSETVCKAGFFCG